MMGGGADLAYSNPLGPEVLGLLNPRSTHEDIVHLINKASDEDEVAATGPAIEDWLTTHRKERQISRYEGLSAACPAFNKDKLRLQAELLKEPLLLRHPDRSLI